MLTVSAIESSARNEGIGSWTDESTMWNTMNAYVLDVSVNLAYLSCLNNSGMYYIGALMAGSPMKARVSAELERRTRAEWPDDDEKTQLDWVADYQASGRLFKALAADLQCSPSFLREYLRIRYGAEVTREAMSRAREEAAHILAEESIEIADDATPEDAQVANLQVRTRQWVAERWNRRELGNQAGATVNINIGSLMLDALRQPVPARIVESAITDAIAEPAEVLSIEGAIACDVE